MNKMEINEILEKDIEDISLDNIYEIENLLLLSHNISEEIAFLKELKKRRNQAIDQSVSNLSIKEDKIRRLILNTMDKHAPDKKLIKFPSVGKVGKRKAIDTWEINNEDELVKFLKDNDKDDGVISASIKINKKELNKILGYYRSQNIDVSCVTYIQGKETLSISFDSNINQVANRKNNNKKKEKDQNQNQNQNINLLDEMTL